MTFGRELSIMRHHINPKDAKLHSVYFIHRRSLANVMGYKTTTDPFVLRGTTNLDITGDTAFTHTEIDTSLDTLNREVLLIWEVDIQHGNLPRQAMNSLMDGAALNTFIIRDQVQTESGLFNLDDQEYIGGKDLQFAGRGGTGPTPEGSTILFTQKNPDSTDFPSRDKNPLAIVTSSTIILRSDFDASIAFLTVDTYNAFFRIHAQRARADADTYAALVTGLM